MLRRLTIRAIGVWLVASVPQAIGQDGRNGPPLPLFMPSIDRTAGPAMNSSPVNSSGMSSSAMEANSAAPLANLVPAPSSSMPIITVPPMAGGVAAGASTSPPANPQTDPRLNWSLGNYDTTPFDPAAFNPPGKQFGWFADLEIGIIKPHLDTHLSTPAGINGPTGVPISLGAAPLDWIGVPEFSVGYRFDQGAGEVRLSYRLIDSSGTQNLGPDSLGNPAQLHTSLSVQNLDLDYITQEYLAEAGDISRFFFRDLRAGIGIRAAAAYFDTRASGYPITDTHIHSDFGGVGPRMFVELHQDLGRSDFQLYSRVSASGVLGPIIQQYDQTSLIGGSSNFANFDTHNKNIGMGIMQFEAGVSWEPQGFGRRFRFTAAYSWERWWNFGRTDSSDAELTLQGAVLRAEYRY